MTCGSFLIAFPLGDGAVSRHFQALADELIARGHSVACLVWGQKNELAKTDSNAAILRWPSKRPTRPRDAFFLIRLIQMKQPDCLIGNFAAVNLMLWGGGLLRCPLRIAWFHTVPFKGDMRGMPSWRLRLLRLRKVLTYRLATHIVFVSEALRTEVTHTVGFPQRDSHVFLNAITDPLFELELGQNLCDPNLIVCVGELSRLKGQDDLIRAIPLLQNDHPDLRVRFFGDGPAKTEYQQLADRLNVSHHCEFMGRVDRIEVLRRLASSNVSVLTSLNDACPYVVIESLALGIPIVATKVGGIPEIVREDLDGFLVPPRNPQSLAEKLSLLLGNPVLRDRMGQQARSRYLEAFEQKQAIACQIQWLEALLNARCNYPLRTTTV